MKRPGFVLFSLGVLTVLAVGALVWYVLPTRRQAHVQVVLASDGALMVAGVPGRSMRAQMQDHRFWNGSSATAPALADFLRLARSTEVFRGTFDGRAVVIVDDRASFQILKMLLASVKPSYPEVSYLNGTVTELPRQHGVDQAQPPAAYVKDCSATPTPPECMAPKKLK